MWITCSFPCFDLTSVLIYMYGTCIIEDYSLYVDRRNSRNRENCASAKRVQVWIDVVCSFFVSVVASSRSQFMKSNSFLLWFARYLISLDYYAPLESGGARTLPGGSSARSRHFWRQGMTRQQILASVYCIKHWDLRFLLPSDRGEPVIGLSESTARLGTGKTVQLVLLSRRPIRKNPFGKQLPQVGLKSSFRSSIRIFGAGLICDLELKKKFFSQVYMHVHVCSCWFNLFVLVSPSRIFFLYAS